jgi:hypothetical protein
MNRREGWEPYPGAASSTQGIAEGAMDELDYFRLELPADARERLKNLDTNRICEFREKVRVYPAGITTHTDELIVGRIRDYKMVLIESGVPAEEHAQRLREHLARVDKDMEDLMKIEARKLKEPSDQGTALLNCIWAFGRRSELVGSPDGIAEQTFNELLASEQHGGELQSHGQIERQQLDAELHEAKKELTAVTGAESGHASPANAEKPKDERTTRRALRDAYKTECFQHSIRVTDEMIATAACPRWHSRTQIQKWLACDPRYGGKADRLIRSVFTKKPHLRAKQ